jgi:hypothetical protein
MNRPVDFEENPWTSQKFGQMIWPGEK